MTLTSTATWFRSHLTRKGRNHPERRTRQLQRAGQEQRIAKERATAHGKLHDAGAG